MAMLLESLASSAAASGAGTAPGCIRQRVRWRLDLTADGEPTGPVAPISEDRRGEELEIPGEVRTSNDLPFLLDKGDYTLGVPTPKADADKAAASAARRHRLWRKLVEEAAAAVADPALGALARFAREAPPVELPAGFDAGQFVAVYVAGRLPTDSPALRAWWRAQTKSVRAELGQCAVCGQLRPIPETLPVMVRGLGRIGGQATMALVSANQNSFERHGLKGAAGGRVCRECGEASHHRLNALLSDEQHRRFHRDAVFVWWSTVEVPDMMTALFEGTRPEDVARLLAGPWRGQASEVGDAARFDAVVLGTSVARVVVRSWVSETLAQTIAHLQRWFSDAAIVDRKSGEVLVPGIGLLGESLRPEGAHASAGPDALAALYACSLQDTPLPDSLAQTALNRIGAQGEITLPRAALLRCWLTRKGTEMTSTLDDTDVDPAYRAGRLLALLDEAAHAATGTSLIERFYGQLSAHPGLVIGRLIDLHQHHLAKLRRDRKGQAGRLQRDIEAVLAGVDRFPAHLDLQGRARFALGLYHEQSAQRARRLAATASAEQETSP